MNYIKRWMRKFKVQLIITRSMSGLCMIWRVMLIIWRKNMVLSLFRSKALICRMRTRCLLTNSFGEAIAAEGAPVPADVTGAGGIGIRAGIVTGDGIVIFGII